jgi:aldose 1-epimerase
MRKLIYIFIALVACNQTGNNTKPDNSPQPMDIEIEERYYGQTLEGDAVTSYTLTNNQGMTMEVINYGGIIVSLTAPDRAGKLQDVVLGFDSLQPYLHGNPFFGALVGRYGNRIAKGKFNLDGEEYALIQNNGENHLHGGTKGFDKVIWESQATDTPDGPMLQLSYTSAHMEEGYPGELSITVTYVLRNDNALQVDYTATTDRPTIVNLTQHTYFNLNPNSETILDHELTLNADHYLPVDVGLIPIGSLKKVIGTPFDFLDAHTVGERINSDHPQLVIGGGYDHCWVLNGPEDDLKTAAVLFDPATGREMTVETTEPGVQFYSANFLNGSIKGKGKSYQKRAALCLETQHFPDSPNRPEYPSVRLDPGETYRTTTVFKFSTRNLR